MVVENISDKIVAKLGGKVGSAIFDIGRIYSNDVSDDDDDDDIISADCCSVLIIVGLLLLEMGSKEFSLTDDEEDVMTSSPPRGMSFNIWVVTFFLLSLGW